MYLTPKGFQQQEKWVFLQKKNQSNVNLKIKSIITLLVTSGTPSSINDELKEREFNKYLNVLIVILIVSANKELDVVNWVCIKKPVHIHGCNKCNTSKHLLTRSAFESAITLSSLMLLIPVKLILVIV